MIITKRGETVGEILDVTMVGDSAPDFEVLNAESDVVSLKDFEGETLLISVFPDINTSVCDLQTREFFKRANEFADVTIINLSNNSVDDLSDWCATKGIDVTMLSDHKLSFAQAYGLYINEIEVLARAVYLLDKNGKLVYKEVLSEITQEPNYDEVLKQAKAVA